MRLSKIKLAGFKSFVDPTTIHLPSNLTGIVGPNGCGKSNTIDAVRWVMGESSAKHLRGASMDDVIFNGSSARKPIDMASVELVFDNSEGKLGGQYASQIQSEAVGDRVRELSILLDRRGVIVDVEEYPSDGVIVLQEYNCPYHELASVHRDVCEMERDAFSLALQAEVKLGNCIQDGHHSCQFVVSSRPQPTRSALVAG